MACLLLLLPLVSSPAWSSSPSRVLAAAQLTEFRSTGVLVVPILTADEIHEARAGLSATLRRHGIVMDKWMNTTDIAELLREYTSNYSLHLNIPLID